MNVSDGDFTAINSLDFEPVKFRLMHKGWPRERADAVEREYRRFLYLMKKFPNDLTAPSVEVDRFWHQHILDTVKYARDCDTVFGHFLHHYPYLGLGLSSDDSALHRSAGERMRELYEDTFGESYQGAAGYAAQPEAAFCTVTAVSAFCTAPSKPAFCTVTAASAFCTVPSEPAFCTVTAAPAFCTVTASSSREAELVH